MGEVPAARGEIAGAVKAAISLLRFNSFLGMFIDFSLCYRYSICGTCSVGGKSSAQKASLMSQRYARAYKERCGA